MDRSARTDLLNEAHRCPITQGGIRDLIARLPDTKEDLTAILDEAVDRSDGHAATCLALAAAAAARPCDAEHIARVLPIVARGCAVIPLVTTCTGDRVTMLARVVESGRILPANAALALLVAVRLLDGAPAPDALRIALRRLARRELDPQSGLLVALAARTLGDAQVSEVAAPWVELADAVGESPLAKDLEALVDTPVLEQLPTDEEPATVSGFTVRRAVRKVGRNEPCPCGSGKKYKRCCADKDRERLKDPSPVAGVTMEEYRERAHEFLPVEEFFHLSPERMATFDPEDLPTPHLIAAYRRWLWSQFWEQAEEALEVLATRDDLPESPGGLDDYRVELLQEASRSGERDLALRQGALMNDLSAFPDLELRLALLEPSAETVATLEAAVAHALAGEDDTELVELAYALLDQLPALGIAVTRGIVDPSRDLDSDLLLDEIERARDVLALPPGDRALSIYDALLGESVGRQLGATQAPSPSTPGQDAGAEAQELRRSLRQAAQRSAALEARLTAANRRLAAQVPQPREVEASPEHVRDDEARRLRAKVKELKGHIAESHRERRDLRTRLADLSRRLDQTTVASQNAASAPMASDAQDDSVASPAPGFEQPLVPRFTDSAARSLRGAPAAVAAAALALAAELAAGRAGPAARVKRLEETGDLWSARVGIHYRLLFRFRADAGELEVCDLVHRGRLDATARRR